MSRDQVEIVRGFWAGLNEDPPRLVLDGLDEEVEIRNPAEFPLQGPFRGHEGARLWFQESWEVFSELHHELEDVIDVGDGATVVSVQRAQGRTRHMQLESNLRWAAVWTFRAGKVLRAQGFIHKRDALTAAGLDQ